MAYTKAVQGECLADGCERTATRRGVCTSCYNQHRKGKLDVELLEPYAVGTRSGGPCAVQGCTEPARSVGHCHGHYERLRRTGDAGGATFRKYGAKAKPSPDKYSAGRNGGVMDRFDAERGRAGHQHLKLHNPVSTDVFGDY